MPIQGSAPGEDFDTIGGLIAHEMGRVPKRGEHLQLCGLHFVVLHTKGGAVRWFKVSQGGRQRPLPTDGGRSVPAFARTAWGSWARIGAMGVAALAGLAQAASLALPGTGQPVWWLQCVSMVVLAGLLHRLRPTWRQGALAGVCLCVGLAVRHLLVAVHFIAHLWRLGRAAGRGSRGGACGVSGHLLCALLLGFLAF